MYYEFILYLSVCSRVFGVVRAVHTDSMQNKLPTVVPFHLFEDCINNHLEDLVDISSNNFQLRGYKIIPIPLLKYH